MARIDRRGKQALDESYRYFRNLEGGAEPELFIHTRSLNTLSNALHFAETGEFKLTRQLWRRLQQALFDRLVASFSGRFMVMNADREIMEFGTSMPEEGYVTFRPDGCKRTEDMAVIEISRLYPKTHVVLSKLWAEGRTRLTPEDVAAVPDCAEDTGVCMMKPVVLGRETLEVESRSGKQEAYRKWWELYWQAYCTRKKAERQELYRHMIEIEAVWGDLYY
jgi:hypothetical protein